MKAVPREAIAAAEALVACFLLTTGTRVLDLRGPRKAALAERWRSGLPGSYEGLEVGHVLMFARALELVDSLYGCDLYFINPSFIWAENALKRLELDESAVVEFGALVAESTKLGDENIGR